MLDLVQIFELKESGQRRLVTALAVSGDGKTAVSASSDGMLEVWDVASGTEVRVLDGQCGPVNSVDLSEDGATAISGANAGAVALWDVASGKLLRVLEASDPLAKL